MREKGRIWIGSLIMHNMEEILEGNFETPFRQLYVIHLTRVWYREFVRKVRQCDCRLWLSLVECLGWVKEFFLAIGSWQISCRNSKIFLHAACFPLTIMSVSLINSLAFWEWIWVCVIALKKHPHITLHGLWRGTWCVHSVRGQKRSRWRWAAVLVAAHCRQKGNKVSLF